VARNVPPDPFKPIYEDVPIEPELGYGESATIRIRVNPTKGQLAVWSQANDLAAKLSDDERRALWVQTMHAFYAECRLPGFDFSTLEAAGATWDSPEIPDELWLYFLQLPWEIIDRRRKAILKNVTRSPETPDSTQS